MTRLIRPVLVLNSPLANRDQLFLFATKQAYLELHCQVLWSE